MAFCNQNFYNQSNNRKKKLKRLTQLDSSFNFAIATAFLWSPLETTDNCCFNAFTCSCTRKIFLLETLLISSLTAFCSLTYFLKREKVKILRIMIIIKQKKIYFIFHMQDISLHSSLLVSLHTWKIPL